MQDDLIYTVKETSKILKTNVDYVYKLIKAGLLPSIKLGTIKITSTSLEEFIEKYEGYDLTNPYEIKKGEFNERRRNQEIKYI